MNEFGVRSAFDRVRVRTPMDSKSKTKQSMKAECDINNIMAKYQKTGAIQHANAFQPEYGFASSIDFLDSMNVVTRAQQMFDALPSSIRGRFGNDPGLFLDFCQDEANASEMIELGLVAQPEVPEPALEVAQGDVPGDAAEPATQ